MDEKAQIIGLSLAFGLWLFVAIKMLVRLVKSRYGKVKTVKAKVIDKFQTETFSKYSGNGKDVQYRILFEAEGKKYSFRVSEFSYHGYQVGEKGTLKYQGDRLIDFHG